MGLCGSKPSKGVPLAAPDSSAPKSNNKTTSKKSTGRPIDATQSHHTLSPREAARVAAEQRNAKLEAANAKTELSQKLAHERAKSRKTHVMEIAQK
ncbi:hypothetical protein KDRO_B05200 [Kluyveromyces lactis]|nr:hypothetical protein KDRO_B05200 [Kluyveromyces lactis]